MGPNVLAPKIIHISGNVYAIVAATYYYSASTGYATTCKLYTVEILPDGTITSLIAQTSFFLNAPSGWDKRLWAADICQVEGYVYAIVYSEQVPYMSKLITIDIYEDGTIGSVVDTTSFASGLNVKDLKILHVYGDTYMVSYIRQYYYGEKLWIRTFEVLPDGTIGGEIDNWQCTANPGIIRYDNASMMRIYGTVFASVWMRTLKTFMVLPDGMIGGEIDTYYFGAESENIMPSAYMFCVSNNIYAIISEDGWGFGRVRTIEILIDGTIGSTIDQFVYTDHGYTLYPSIIHTAGAVYLLVYSDNDYGNESGIIKTMVIQPDGAITGTDDEYTLQDSAQIHRSDMIHLSSNKYVVVYSRPEARLSTISVSPCRTGGSHIRFTGGLTHRPM